jgi:glycosyltransferase involved in cell wall biosynthesis
MRVLVLSRYDRLGASSRVRFLQYLPYLEARGIKCTVSPLFGDDYVRGLYAGRIPLMAVARGYWSRVWTLVHRGGYDLVWLEKEALPWLPDCVEELLLGRGTPLVIDYDDAWFHRYDRHPMGVVRAWLGHKIDTLMARADVVVAGNGYLAERARAAGARRVEILPTVVDTTHYRVGEQRKADSLTIGWIGSPGTMDYLRLIGPVLREIVDRGGMQVLAVGACGAAAAELAIQTVKWSEDTEVQCIQQFDIGIMPVPDEPFERGKCGYKVIQYMACGKPVVASPVGANREIVRHGVDGFLVNSETEWMDSIVTLSRNATLREHMGQAGRARVVSHYSLDVAAPRLHSILLSAKQR